MLSRQRDEEAGKLPCVHVANLGSAAPQVFKEFVFCLDFAGMNLVVALRKSRPQEMPRSLEEVVTAAS